MKIHHVAFALLVLSSCSKTTTVETTPSSPTVAQTTPPQTETINETVSIEYMDELTILESSATITLQKKEINDLTIEQVIDGYVVNAKNTLSEDNYSSLAQAVSDQLNQTNTSIDTIINYIDTHTSTGTTTDTFNNDDLSVIITNGDTMIYVDHDDHVKITDPTTESMITIDGINDVLMEHATTYIDQQTSIMELVASFGNTTE